MHDSQAPAPACPHPPPTTRRARFFGSYWWLILKNLIGWPLIIASFVAGPLVPGPSGIPLFLAGFALVSFPGKRRLTARVLRGKPVRVPPAPFAAISLVVALLVPVIVLVVGRGRSRWITSVSQSGPLAVASLYCALAAVTWLIARTSPHVLNVLLRGTARARRRTRPWLRRHHVHLLPPRWRRRRADESGRGAMRIKAEVLKLYRRRRP